MNRRRKTDLIEANEYALANPMPEINRAHRDCERECIELKSQLDKQEILIIKQDKRISSLESLLVRAGDEIYEYNNFLKYISEALVKKEDIKNTKKLLAEIDAILPATEDKKDD